MPRKRSDIPLEKVTLKLFQGDYKRIQDLHGTRLGASAVIRQLIRTYLANIDARVEQRSTIDKINLEVIDE